MKKIEDQQERLSRIMSPKLIWKIAEEQGTPIYAYFEEILDQQANRALAFPNSFGLTVRYAMKTNPSRAIIQFFSKKGIEIDASSGFEVHRAMLAGVSSGNILFTSQEIPADLKRLVDLGAHYNATSLGQLDYYGRLFPNSEVSARINPGRGSGGTNRTNTGGEGSSFGIWHEQLPDAMKIAKRHGLRIYRLHTHIGSGSDPEVWKQVSHMSLEIARKMIQDYDHDLRILNLGGGYKVGRMGYEQSIDMQECGEHVRKAFEQFRADTGKRLRLEIEPGTFLVANAGIVIFGVSEIKKTPLYKFVMTNTGMTELPRQAMYGAQHPMIIVPKPGSGRRGTDIYLGQGHCCESGDGLTPAKGEPEVLGPRRLKKARAGDLGIVAGAGAYCAGMSMKNYNSYPEAPEVMVDKTGNYRLIRRRQTLDQITQNEV